MDDEIDLQQVTRKQRLCSERAALSGDGREADPLLVRPQKGFSWSILLLVHFGGQLPVPSKFI